MCSECMTCTEGLHLSAFHCYRRMFESEDECEDFEVMEEADNTLVDKDGACNSTQLSAR